MTDETIQSILDSASPREFAKATKRAVVHSKAFVKICPKCKEEIDVSEWRNGREWGKKHKKQVAGWILIMKSEKEG